MIIVSQDKMKILNFKQLQEIEINTPEDWNQGFYSIDTYPLGEGNRTHIRLGIYKTEKKAKEVLQEIVNKYRQFNVDNNQAITLIPKVYEMPKE